MNRILFAIVSIFAFAALCQPANAAALGRSRVVSRQSVVVRQQVVRQRVVQQQVVQQVVVQPVYQQAFVAQPVIVQRQYQVRQQAVQSYCAPVIQQQIATPSCQAFFAP